MADLEFYTIKDVQNMLQIGHVAAHALFLSDDFPGLKVGKSFRVEKKAFEKWCQSTKSIKLGYAWNGGKERG
ncbi:Helix-turn-helix domain-containing protein [Butyrivibrio fibrisolvens]|uniref:Helix-turn-helix domain-containing protein n=1 Tax=Butyrivibrio fibrisolvens TaxID=831 RepID=A0A1H9XB70_BUTFI|nr:helix-turn-helix domain-containing protein [Butyrivibrio fibrisolvens]SES43375.1 Helix-turn-helix domain-containing protein [Butyrivibrio fibrisolvens]